MTSPYGLSLSRAQVAEVPPLVLTRLLGFLPRDRRVFLYHFLRALLSVAFEINSLKHYFSISKFYQEGFNQTKGMILANNIRCKFFLLKFPSYANSQHT